MDFLEKKSVVSINDYFRDLIIDIQILNWISEPSTVLTMKSLGRRRIVDETSFLLRDPRYVSRCLYHPTNTYLKIFLDTFGFYCLKHYKTKVHSPHEAF